MNWLLSDCRGWAAAGLVCCATVAVALATPVRPPASPPTAPPAPLPGLSAEVAAVAARKELAASRRFSIESTRWGHHGQKTRRRAAPPAPEPAKMNYVGLITIHDQRTVLFEVPNVGVVRYAPGDRLPDGRVLVSVTDDSLTLRAEGRPDEVFMLFPTIENNTENDARRPGRTGMRAAPRR